MVLYSGENLIMHVNECTSKEGSMICEIAGNKMDVALFTHIRRGFHIIYSEKQSNQQYEYLRAKLFVVALRVRHLDLFHILS